MTDQIFYQGLPGAFSHNAASLFNARHGLNSTLTGCASFEDVFAAVVSSPEAYGALPVENSTIGPITPNYDLLIEHDVTILAECYLPVNLCLAGKENATVADIKEAYSHPAALEQCKQFFKAHRSLRAVLAADTAGAAEMISRETDAGKAAIASLEAVNLYKLRVLQEKIQDYSCNATRFILISADKNRAVQPTDKPLKLSLLFEAGHARQTLLSSLSAEYPVSSLVSRPIPSEPFNYTVFLDIIPGSDIQASSVLSDLSNTAGLRALGTYHCQWPG